MRGKVEICFINVLITIIDKFKKKNLLHFVTCNCLTYQLLIIKHSCFIKRNFSDKLTILFITSSSIYIN